MRIETGDGMARAATVTEKIAALSACIAALREDVKAQERNERTVLALDALGIMAVQVQWLTAALCGAATQKIRTTGKKKGHEK